MKKKWQQTSASRETQTHLRNLVCVCMFASVASCICTACGAIWTDRARSRTLWEPWDNSGNRLTACLTVPRSLLCFCVSTWHAGQIVSDHMVRIAGVCQGAWQWNWRAEARHMGDIQALSFASCVARRGEAKCSTPSKMCSKSTQDNKIFCLHINFSHVIARSIIS